MALAQSIADEVKRQKAAGAAPQPQAPAVPEYKSNVYQAKQVSGPLPEYDAMRRRLQQRTTAETQGQQDALQRRFAAVGQMNSGAAIKQSQLAAEAGAQRQEDAIAGVDSQEAAARRQMQEAEDQRAFQSQESEQGRAFGAHESAIGRQFQSSEAEKQRGFQKGMFDEDMAFKRSAQEWQQKFQEQEFNFNRNTALSQMDDDDLAKFANSEDVYRGNPNASASDYRAYNAWKKAQDERLREEDKRKKADSVPAYSTTYRY